MSVDNILIIKPKSEAMRSSFPAEKRWVERVEYPKEGGILTYFKNERYPEKQLIYPEMVAQINPIKRSVINAIRLIEESHLLKFLIFLSFILPGGKKLRKILLKYYVDMFWSGLHLMSFKPEFMCTSVRELRRALLKFTNETNMVDMLCSFLEGDNAYRYPRFQDPLGGILNKEAFLKNPTKEFKRTFAEYEKRELLKGGFTKKMRGVMFFVLLFIITHKKLVKDFIIELDQDKIKLSIEDFRWSAHRTDYNIEGLDLTDRMRKVSMINLKGK